MTPRGAQLLAAAQRGRIIDSSIPKNVLELDPNAPGFPRSFVYKDNLVNPDLRLTSNSSPTMVVNEGSNQPTCQTEGLKPCTLRVDVLIPASRGRQISDIVY